jgi:integrase
MARPKKLWMHQEGQRGSTVWVQERTPGGNLYLRWRDRIASQWVWECLGHTDQEAGKQRAIDQVHTLRSGRESLAKGIKTLAYIFALYERDETSLRTAEGQNNDCRRMELWQTYLGSAFDVMALKPSIMKAFIRDRGNGKVQIPGRELSSAPSDTTIGKDVRFLGMVLNWAQREGHVPYNPIGKFRAPKNLTPKRPVASYDRFLRIRPHCKGLFGPFMDLVESLGWRVSALRQLKASDLDLQSRPEAPKGRILKRAETDKIGVEAWVPLSPDARRAIDGVLELNPVVGDVYLFPAPVAKGKPWGERNTWKKLREAEKAAGLEHLEHGAFHPYRRKWVRERKHLPKVDVAAAGGWLDTRTLSIYEGPDDKTMLAVVNEPRKLRESVEEA